MIGLNKNIMGIIFMILGMFCLSVNDVVVKGLNISFPVWEVIFFRAFSGMLVSFVLILIFGWRSLQTKINKPTSRLTSSGNRNSINI